MPSKRPSPSALDAAPATHLHPSPPKSKKRSSRPKPRMDDPNPNPNSKPHSSSDSPAAPSRKSERKRKPRSFPDSAAAAAGGGASAGGGHGAVQKLWSDADEVALLTGAAAFRARTGTVPRLPDMGALFESIKGSLSPHLDQAKVYYKLKRLKSKFLHTAPSAAGGGGPHDRRVRDLSADVWGSDAPPGAEEDADGEEAEEADADERNGGEAAAAARCPVVSEVLGEYWRANGHALSGVSLEKGMALLGAEEGRVAEAKWRRQLEAEMRTRMRRHDMSKEVYGLLIEAVKGLGP